MVINYTTLGKLEGDCATTTGISIAAIARSAETVAFADSRIYGANAGSAWINGPDVYPRILPLPDECFEGWQGTSSGWNWPAGQAKATSLGYLEARHQDGLSVSFTDGHVKYMKSQSLAAGTNFGPGVLEDGVIVTNKDLYLWDRD